MSDEEEYRRMVEEAANLQVCKACGIIGMKSAMDPHHPAGRSHGNILNFVWVHRSCHQWTHDNPQEATDMGLLDKGRNTRHIDPDEKPTT